MPDRLSTEIWIGGDIPQQLVSELCQVIHAEGVALDWGARPFQPQTAEDLQASVPTAETLRLCDEQAAWGCLEQLEKFLQEHRIAFRRRCEGRYEFEPELAEYRPGYGLVTLETNAGGYPVVLALDLVPVRHLLEAALNAADGQPNSRLLSLVQTALKVLREQLPPELPPLEPFRIVRDGDSDTCISDVHGESQDASATPLPGWLAEVDWAMLRRQKEWLASQASTHPDQAEGLLSLLDALQDYAIDKLGLSEHIVLSKTQPRTNQDRAERAVRVLNAYGTVEGPERDDLLTDLLTDLQHYCQSHDLDWTSALELAARHFEAERAGE
jgi:hypothetical protein